MTVTMTREGLVNLTVEDYAELLRRRVPFAQANYGDGEWACLLGAKGQNVNGERYAPALRDALRATLLTPRAYLYGTNPGRRWRDPAAEFVRRHGVADKIRWVWKDTLSGANVRGEIGPVFRALRDRHVILVGPPHLRKLQPDLLQKPPGGHRHFVTVHPHEAWKGVETTLDQIWSLMRTETVVLFAAGMATNLMIHAMWPGAPVNHATLLDVGAIFDPYVGHYTRKHYRRPSWRDTSRPKNIAESQEEIDG